MPSFVQLAAWACCVLLCVLVWRGVAGRTLKRYPLFYGYVVYVLLTTIFGLCNYALPAHAYAAYRRYYWTTEFIAVLLGFGVTWEIYTRVLAYYPGVRRLAWALLAAILAAVLLHSATGASPWVAAVADIERNLRTIQAVVLLTLFALVAYYAIPVGKNVRGIAAGYVLFIATSVLNLSLRSYLGRVWRYGQALEYSATVGIWCSMLWSYHPNPVPENDMERDYQWLSNQTVNAMVRLRSHLLHPDGS